MMLTAGIESDDGKSNFGGVTELTALGAVCVTGAALVGANGAGASIAGGVAAVAPPFAPELEAQVSALAAT